MGVFDVQSVHVKNRCAFLNHSSNSGEFMQLVEEHPNVALWFSVSTHQLPIQVILLTAERSMSDSQRFFFLRCCVLVPPMSAG